MANQQISLGLCESCRELKEVAWTDTVGREYCGDCFAHLPVPTAARLYEYLGRTVPFAVGERVACHTAGVLYDGEGVITEVSTELKHYGTPVYPSFLVRIDTKAYPEAPDSCWYTEVCLQKVSDE